MFRIKKLEWKDGRNKDECLATTGVWDLDVSRFRDRYFRFVVTDACSDPVFSSTTEFATLDAAKAAAESWHEAAVLTFLEPLELFPATPFTPSTETVL